MTTLSASALLPFLPQEILVEILSKLPAKSLVRFKCVSKFFSSLLVDHPFTDLHRNWSLTLPSRMSILILYPVLWREPNFPNFNWHYTINYSEENQGNLHLQANRLQYFDDNPNLFRKLYLSSSLNGLICFCRFSDRSDEIAIHNLSTRQHIPLPSNCHYDGSCKMNAFGLLGFDSGSRRYKVLKSVEFTTGDSVSVKHWVFTLGVDKSWREIHSSPYYHPYNCFNNHFYSTSVHIDGVIYSLNSLNKDGDIVAFDFRTENFRAIPPPPSTTMWVGPTKATSGLVKVDGRLAFVNNLKRDELNPLRYGMTIWILEEESIAWKKQYVIHFPISLEGSFNKTNLFFASNHVGEIAVLVMLKRSVPILLFYNFRKRSWRKFDIYQLPVPHLITAMHFISDNIF
ncbi:PREDICTED: putative F-box protein At1g32420 [Ipomoea nil]|uniref:putative F-box protein At1g32420 n=1 Tax=Ipomoea nil TaxID=35883 RepID=UPI0009011206|nr:PREDICTED: putative F-box protein At1g32420 [Ipomoea nil]